MTQSNSSLSFFIWKLEPKCSFGFLIAIILISIVFGSIWRMFPNFYPEHIIFAVFHHLLAFLALLFMFITSWASPGRIHLSENANNDQNSQRCDDVLTNQDEKASKRFSVEMGKCSLIILISSRCPRFGR